jgi:hypothetical protein
VRHEKRIAIDIPPSLPLAAGQPLLYARSHSCAGCCEADREALLHSLDAEEGKEFESRFEKLEFKPDKKALARELKTGIAIPGVDLKFGDLRLVISQKDL